MSLLGPYLAILTAVALLGSALIAGVFFAFSNFVMKALTDLPAAAGAQAMRRINITVLNPGFLLAFLGTAALCALLVAVAALAEPHSSRAWLLVGGLAYLLGTFGVTVLGNVPLNNLLARAPSAEAAADLWPLYVKRWLIWNHVRAVLSMASAGAFAVALFHLRLSP